jgi:UV DNA damage repair endonuclease
VALSSTISATWQQQNMQQAVHLRGRAQESLAANARSTVRYLHVLTFRV